MPLSRPSGALSLKVFRPRPRPVPANLAEAIAYGAGYTRRDWRSLFGIKSQALEWQRANAEHFRRSLEDQLQFDVKRLPMIGYLWGEVLRADGSRTDLGLMSCRVVTDAGVGFIVDAFQNLVELETMKYHAVGTGSTAESAGQTALVTELTTQYTPANTRATGTLGEKSGDSKTYETTATVTVSAGVAITEHAIMSQAATGGGVMIDRSVFAAVNLASSESLQATYQLTFNSGG